MSEPVVHRPADAGQLRELVAWAVAEEQPLEIAGNGTKRILGRPVEAEHLVSVAGLSEIAPMSISLTRTSACAAKSQAPTTWPSAMACIAEATSFFTGLR